MRCWLSRAMAGVVLLLLVGAAAPAAAQGGAAGQIVGKVADTGGGVLPGVTVTLTGPAAMGTPTVDTNESGAYRFPSVQVGTYTLTFQLAGFGNFVREGVIVSAGVTVTIDAQMGLASLAESVTVSGASPVVDLENARIGSKVTAEVLDALPTSKTLWGTATLAPGVVLGTQDPSGRSAFTKANMISHGALNYSANYFGITAETAINTGSMYYLDMEATDELSVDSAAMSAEYGGTGGLNINIIPKSGGNLPAGSFSFARTGKGMLGDNLTDDLRAVGVTLPSLESLYDTHANFGGPIKTDKLWFFGAYQEFRTYSNAAKFPELVREGLRNYLTRLTYQVGQNGRLAGAYYYNKKMGYNNGAGPTTPNPMSTSLQRSPKNLFVGNYTTIMPGNSFLDASVGHFDLKNPAGYSQQWVDLPLAEKQLLYRVTNSTTGVNSGPAGPSLEQDSDRFEAKAALSLYRDGWIGASHQIKTGFDVWRGSGKNGYSAYKDSVFTTRDVNGVTQPVSFDAYQGPIRKNNTLYSSSAFVDDRITWPSVTVNLGGRFTNYHGAIGEEIGLASQWFPELRTAPVDVPISWNTFMPRTGFVWKLTDSGKDVVKGTYGRYVEWIYTTTFASIDPMQTRSLATYTWFGDQNANGYVEPNEYNPNPISVFRPPNNSIDPDLKDPKVDEVTFGYEREVAANIGLAAIWVERWFTDNYADVNVGIPASAYVPRVFNDAGPDNLVNTGDDRPITLYDVSSAFLGKDAFRRQTVDGTARHQNFEIALSRRLVNRWSTTASYDWTRNNGVLLANGLNVANGDFRQIADPTNPNAMINSTGRQANVDQPHSFKVTGIYQAPGDFSVGTIFQALSGLTRDRTFRATLTQGTTTVLAEPRGTYRNDFMKLWSINGHKRFRFNSRTAVILDVEVHNLLNSHASQAGIGTQTQAFANQAAYDAAKAGTTTFFGRRTLVLDPRLLKIILKVEF